jgi:hypothetical protein
MMNKVDLAFRIHANGRIGDPGNDNYFSFAFNHIMIYI